MTMFHELPKTKLQIEEATDISAEILKIFN